MKNLALLLLAFPIILLTACGGDKKEEPIDVEKNPLGALMKMGENMKENAEKMEKKAKDGKNAVAIHYEELIKYLPESVAGFKRNEDPSGASMDMGEMSYSSAEVRFENEKGDRINITLLDYNAAYSMYSMATAMWASGFKIDTSEELGQSINLGENINGWESFRKKQKDASIVLGIGDRFLLTIEGNNQKDCEFLKGIAKSMDIKKLASIE